METQKVFTWKIAGVGGYGLQAGSSLLGKVFLRSGLYVSVYDEFPSIIKGGSASSQVTVSEQPMRSPRQAVNLLVCLNEQSVREYSHDLVPGGWLIYDSTVIDGSLRFSKDVVAFPVPLSELIAAAGVEKIMRNVVSVGVTLQLLGFPLDAVKDIIRSQYSRKGQEVVDENERALDQGARYVKLHPPQKFPVTIRPRSFRSNRMLITGNDALGMGALAAGIRFYAGYPMTPSSSLLSFMVNYGPGHGVVVRQLPDEIAVVNAAIGASFAGVRAMVASSGGGFSLMVESLGLAAMTETPLVIVDAQRPGPSTGLPTWTEQGDLRFVLHAGQGDFPRIVLAPGDVAECFQVMPIAFNIADRFQTPVIVLTDKFLGESWFTTEKFTTSGIEIHRGAIIKKAAADSTHGFFARYADVSTGVSPRSFPGTHGLPFMANSDEHDSYGMSHEEIAIRVTQHTKRLRKLKGISMQLPQPRLYGRSRANLTVVAWGSTKGPILDAIDILAHQGLTVNLIHSTTLSPFPALVFRSNLVRMKRLVLVEGNATAQLAGLIRQYTGIEITDHILRYDGRPFEAYQLAQSLGERLNTGS